jgi:hypothetical protein
VLIALALGLIALGIILFLLGRQKGSTKPEQEEITLEQLSTLWKEPEQDSSKLQETSNNVTLSKSEEEESHRKESNETKNYGKWQNESVKEFWKKEVLPFRCILESQSALFPILRILTLLDKYGSCPSIVSAHENQEAKDLKNHWEILAKVSLSEHTLRVACHMTQIYRSQYKDQILRGAYILAGLSHDLGKIPHLREKKVYALGDHPIISAEILIEVARGVPYLEQVVHAVKSHHFPKPQDELAQHLQQADKKAREEELMLFGREGEEVVLEEEVELGLEDTGTKVIPFPLTVAGEPKTSNKFIGKVTIPISQSHIPPWLSQNLPEILKRVLPHINQPTGFGRWKAISSPNGICYIDPELLLEKAREVMRERQITDITFMDDSLKEKAKILIASALRERGWLGDGVKEGYYGAYWNYELQGQVKQGYWTPILATAFGVMPHELEMKKRFPIKGIKNIELCVGEKA